MVRCLLVAPGLLGLAGAAGAGVPEGLEWFGKQRYADARKELAEPAAVGDIEAMAAMGEMLSRGQGGNRDELKARDYILKALEGGSLRATHMAGTMYVNGNLVAKDEARGVALVQKAAEQGFAASQSLLGVWLSRGLNGLEKNELQGMGWFVQAAAQNDALAMNWLGDAAENGKAGVAQDALQALDWYKKSGELGNSSSMLAAGRMYALGKGVTADGNEALRWFRRALAAGNGNAFLWTGSVYEFGRGGVGKSLILAHAWYSAVPVGASPELLKSIRDSKERVAKLMTPADLEEAGKAAKTVMAQALAAEAAASSARTAAGAAPPTLSSGSGVAVNALGDILTNEHVIRGCTRVRVQPAGLEARVVAKDAKNDLALLRVEGASFTPVRLRVGKGLRLGDEVVVIGFPLRKVLSSGPIVTTGSVSALSGYKDDTSLFQMSAAVQPGSSGGPIADSTGALVGLVQSRLQASGQSAPQNVNFGINMATVSGFLEAHGVRFTAQPATARNLNVPDVAESLQKAAVGVECY